MSFLRRCNSLICGESLVKLLNTKTHSLSFILQARGIRISSDLETYGEDARASERLVEYGPRRVFKPKEVRILAFITRFSCEGISKR